MWTEQRKFVMRHLRNFGFGRNTMNVIVEYEAQKLVEHFKKLLQSGNDHQITDVQKPVNNYVGQIYKLQRDPNNLKKQGLHEKSNLIEYHTAEKHASTAANLYVKAEDYTEVRGVAQSVEMTMFMHNAFGVTVLNTLWRIMAGKRCASFPKLSSFIYGPPTESESRHERLTPNC